MSLTPNQRCSLWALTTLTTLTLGITALAFAVQSWDWVWCVTGLVLCTLSLAAATRID